MLNSSNFEHIAQLVWKLKSSSELVADFVKVSKFATIHRVFLGIQEDHETLDDYLRKSQSASPLTGAIDIPDSTGSSVLAWAIEYGCADVKRSLLKHGANPHQPVRSFSALPPLYV